jgi:hypothetical protein
MNTMNHGNPGNEEHPRTMPRRGRCRHDAPAGKDHQSDACKPDTYDHRLAHVQHRVHRRVAERTRRPPATGSPNADLLRNALTSKAGC